MGSTQIIRYVDSSTMVKDNSSQTTRPITTFAKQGLVCGERVLGLRVLGFRV